MTFEALIAKSKTKTVTKPIQLKVASELVDEMKKVTHARNITIRDFMETCIRDGLNRVVKLTQASQSKKNRPRKQALAS